MGYYINTKSETKEAFLEREGIFTLDKPIWSEIPKGMLPVVLINNGLFTAAGIAYSKKELDAFSEPGDRRPKTYYLVAIRKLFLVTDPYFADLFPQEYSESLK